MIYEFKNVLQKEANTKEIQVITNYLNEIAPYIQLEEKAFSSSLIPGVVE